ncbi:MAG: fumarylacetoacetate hydrolase family protein [Rhodobacteraceae bacterium]|nr:fumarylacetoacetate hydrolase family protein [Paracoccaceae bacterium]
MTHWARVRTASGATQTGVVDAGAFHPRAALGSDTPAGDPVALEQVHLLPPCVPGKFVGLWNNFHASAERNGLSAPAHPLFFLKPGTALAGPQATVAIPAASRRVIFEGELGIAIGATCRDATPETAEAAIFGYTCVHDFTALDILFADETFPQWTRAKGFDNFGVIGPVIATGLDWRDLTVRVTVDGRERQSYPASDMILSPPEIVRLLSQDMTLEPGDVIACGTSLGARPVKAGQVVEVLIDGIGGLPVTMA